MSGALSFPEDTMTMLVSPAPYGSTDVGLLFGNTTVPPYTKSNPHKGRDWKWSYARPIKSRQVHAPVSGRVVAAYNDGAFRDGWGNYVDIEVAPGVRVRLAHLVGGKSVLTKVGQWVTAGQQVGTMGATGRTGGKVHLHEELWLGDTRVNPDTYRAPYGKHLPGTEPKPAPAGGNSKPATPAAPTLEEDDDMTVYAKAKGAKDVYEIKDGRKRLLGPAEWTAIKTGLAAAGRKVPYSNGKLTVAQITSIPTVK